MDHSWNQLSTVLKKTMLGLSIVHTQESIMITKKVGLVLSSVTLIAGSMLSMPTLADAGKGWDVFHIGAEERIPAPSKMGPSVTAGAGKGWDVFHIGAGEPIHVVPSNGGASNQYVADAGWDVYGAGEKQ
jgi:hypothetical protein